MRPIDPALVARGTDDDPRLGWRLVDDPRDAEVVIVGGADDTGVANSGGRVGAKDGPTEIRRWLYKSTTGMNGDLERLRLFDAGDVTPSPTIEETHVEIERVVGEHARAERVVVFLGGGHDLAFASQSAIFESIEGRGAVVNVDTHLDVRPPKDGHLITSGTPFRRLLERFGERASLVELGIQPQHNARAHAELVRAHSGRIVTLDELRRVDGGLVRELDRAAVGASFLTLSLDLDVAPASIAPGTSAPPADGLCADALAGLCEAAGRNPKTRLLDVMELSPPHDENGKTARLAALCVWRFLLGAASLRE